MRGSLADSVNNSTISLLSNLFLAQDHLTLISVIANTREIKEVKKEKKNQPY